MSKRGYEEKFATFKTFFFRNLPYNSSHAYQFYMVKVNMYNWLWMFDYMNRIVHEYVLGIKQKPPHLT